MTLTASDVDAFVVDNNIGSIGKLSLLLFVTNQLSQMSYPFSFDPLLTQVGGQIKGLSGPAVGKILLTRGVDIPVEMLGEGGRTSRGSVGRALKYVIWLNSRLKDIDGSVFELLEIYWAKKIEETYASQLNLRNHLPTSDPNYIGPRFAVENNKIVLKKGRVSQAGDDAAIVESVLQEIRLLVGSLRDSFHTAHNSYHLLKATIARYEVEIKHRRSQISIFAVYYIGLQIEIQLAAATSGTSEDPPLDADRAAMLSSFLALQGILIAATDEGKKLLAAVARHQASEVDLNTFRQQAVSLAQAAKHEGLLEERSADFVVDAASIAGSGKTPLRTALFAILTSRNFWSSVIGTVILEGFKKSGVGQHVVSATGSLIDVGYKFISTHAAELIALAHSAPDHFRWLVRVVEWLKQK